MSQHGHLGVLYLWAVIAALFTLINATEQPLAKRVAVIGMNLTQILLPLLPNH